MVRIVAVIFEASSVRHRLGYGNSPSGLSISFYHPGRRIGYARRFARIGGKIPDPAAGFAAYLPDG